MATSRNFGFSLLLLCLALVSYKAMARGGGRSGDIGALAVSDVAGPDETVFNVLQYGAKANDKKQSTQAFIKAWVDACKCSGKARVVIPEGEFVVGPVTFQGPCSSPSPIIVQVIGTVKATKDISEYSSPEWFSFEQINGLIVFGGGTFDGQGPSVWKYNDCRTNTDCMMLASNFKFQHVTNASIRRINSVDSKGFHITINQCNNLRLKGLRITAPETSPNTDGIHIGDSSNIKIAKSVISSGDDCISIGKGATNIEINRITCGPGHGISVGSLGKYENETDVRGVRVKNCTLLSTDNGIRIKSWPARFQTISQASGILFEDIVMESVKNPIIIDQGYCSGAAKGHCNSKPSLVKIRDVYYRNIRGTTISPVAVKIACSEQFPCQNVTLFDVNLQLIGKGNGNLKALPTISSSCTNAKVGYGGTQVPPPCP